MQTNYPGIDYGLGRSNVSEIGIRFGVIPQNALDPDAAQDVWFHGRNLTFENYLAEAKDKIRNALSDFFSDYKHGDKPSKLESALADCFEVIEQDLSDGYDSGDDQYLYESEGYKVSTSETDLFIEQSPYFTYAQFCSPCAPGACYLLNPLETPVESNRAYCFGHDWFEDATAPYPVYSVKTGKQVVPQEQKHVCPNCGGSGKDTLARIAKARNCKVADINLAELRVDNLDTSAGTFDCFRCNGKGSITETVYVEL